MKPALIVSLLLVVVLSAFGWAEHRNRKAAEIRADSALAGYHRLAADSILVARRERLADAERDSLKRRVAQAEQEAKDSIEAVVRTLAVLDARAVTTLSAAKTVRDSMLSYRDLYTEQRAATGRLLAAAALATGRVLAGKDSIIESDSVAIREARAERDRWKGSAGQLAKSVEELKGGGTFLGFIPKPPKWAAALITGTVGCGLGALIDTQHRGAGCVKGGATAAAVGTVVTPTD